MCKETDRSPKSPKRGEDEKDKIPEYHPEDIKQETLLSNEPNIQINSTSQNPIISSSQEHQHQNESNPPISSHPPSHHEEEEQEAAPPPVPLSVPNLPTGPIKLDFGEYSYEAEEDTTSTTYSYTQTD